MFQTADCTEMKSEIEPRNIPGLMEPDTSLKNLLKKMASAGIGASLAELATIPIDTAKVRLQVNVPRMCSSSVVRRFLILSFNEL